MTLKPASEPADTPTMTPAPAPFLSEPYPTSFVEVDEALARRLAAGMPEPMATTLRWLEAGLVEVNRDLYDQAGKMKALAEELMDKATRPASGMNPLGEVEPLATLIDALVVKRYATKVEIDSLRRAADYLTGRTVVEPQ